MPGQSQQLYAGGAEYLARRDREPSEESRISQPEGAGRGVESQQLVVLVAAPSVTLLQSPPPAERVDEQNQRLHRVAPWLVNIEPPLRN